MVTRNIERITQAKFDHYNVNHNPIYKLLKDGKAIETMVLNSKNGNYELNEESGKHFNNVHLKELYNDENNLPVFEYKYDVPDNSYHLGDVTGYAALDVVGMVTLGTLLLPITIAGLAICAMG